MVNKMSKNNQKRRSGYLIKNTIVFAIGEFGAKLISFVLVPLYTYTLSTADYGSIDLISTISMLAIPVLTLNVSEAIMRFALDTDADNNKIMSAGLLMMLCAVVCGLVVIPVTKWFDSTVQYGIWIYFYIAVSICSQILLSNLRGQERLLEYSLGNMLHTFSSAVFNILFLVILQLGIKGYFLAAILAGTVSAAYAFARGNVWKVFGQITIDRKLLSEMLRFSVVLIPTSFMWWVMSSSDRLMITWIVGASANGIYAVACKLPNITSTLSSIFNRAWSYSAIREHDENDYDSYNNLIYNGLVAVVLIVASGLLLIVKPFMGIYVAPDYYTAWKYTPVLVLGTAMMTLGSFAATPYTVHKDSLGFLKSGMAGAAVNIVLNFLFIPNIGVFGAALATCVSYLIVFVYRVWDTKKYLKLNVWQKRHLLGFALLVIQVGTSYLANPWEMILHLTCFVCLCGMCAKEWLAILCGILKKVRR